MKEPSTEANKQQVYKNNKQLLDTGSGRPGGRPQKAREKGVSGTSICHGNWVDLGSTQNSQKARIRVKPWDFHSKREK